MRVKELKLHNFRGIKDLHLVFNTEHNVVVLVGVNGVGKSSILDCINLLIRYFVTFSSKVTVDIEKYSIFFDTILLDSDIHITEVSTNNYIKVNLDENIDVEWEIVKFREKEANYSWNEYHENSQKSINDYLLNSTRDRSGNHLFYYLSNRKLLEEIISPILLITLPAYVSQAEDIINFENFSKWFRETENLENELRLSDNIEYRHPTLDAVRLAVYSLLGEGYENLTFKRTIDRMIIKKSGREIAVELLSDGEKSLLAMVGHLSRKLAEYYKSLHNPLEASVLVLIDEIELHLHPAWQRMIIPRLTQTFPNCQFIVTTHSPQVLSHVDPECIHILDYDGENVVVKRPDSSYGLDSNRILEDILGVSKRPQEIQDRMSELFRTINDNDLDGAKEIVRELGDKIGISEPELVKAEATIKRREIIGR